MALLAQWLERAAVNRKVTGSIPVGSALLPAGGVNGVLRKRMSFLSRNKNASGI